MTRDSRHPLFRTGTCARLALAPLTVVSVLLVSGPGARATTADVPAVPTSVTANQSVVASDLAVSWTPATSGVLATGALVQLYQQINGTFTYQSAITCGANCTSVIFRGLTFGWTYDATVTPILMASGSSREGANAVSNPVTLTTSCTVGACVSIDATSSIGPVNHAAAGILNSTYPVGNESADFKSLDTPMFRSAPLTNSDGSFNWTNWNLAVADGAQTTVVLSDVYNAAYEGDSPPTPWSDWSAYNAEITGLVTRLADSGEQINYWEVYNEPGGNDGYYSAAGYASETPTLLLQQFLDTYQDITAVVPGAKIVGPSLAYWSDYPGQFGSDDHSFDMATFLNFAAQNNLKLAAVSWHEELDNLGPTPEENTLAPAMIEDHVATARRLIAALPQLGDPLIFINEYGMPEVQSIPGWDVAYLSALADAGVNSANRSCWNGACGEPALDGLLDDDGVSTPPIYYERLVYAAMSGNMVATNSTIDAVTAVGAFDPSTGTLTSLVGRGVGCTQSAACASAWPSATPAAPTTVNVSITLPWSSGLADIAVSDIEGQNSSTVTASTPTQVQAVITAAGASSGTVTLSLPNFADGDADAIVITHTPFPNASTPVITNLPVNAMPGGGFTAAISTDGDGPLSVTSSTPAVCTVVGLAITYLSAGICSLTAHVGNGTSTSGVDGTPQSFSIGQTPGGAGPPSGGPVGPPACSGPPGGEGYLLSAADGGVFTFGTIPFCGSTGAIRLNKPVVGAALTPDRGGYWEVASDGGIFAFGDAGFYGSTGALHLNSPIVAMASSPGGLGYWLVAADGGIFAFGDATFEGSAGAAHLPSPIVGMAATTDGLGYWLVAADGQIYAFGDAPNLGSANSSALRAPIVAIAADPTTGGYWEVAADGGVFAFDAPFLGSTGGFHLNQPIVGMSSTATGNGYAMVAADGGVFTFGDATYDGSMGGIPLNQPIVAMSAA
jgi:hypothetical protein